MAIRKLARSWQYDFKPPDYPRQRKGGYRTKAEAEAAERARRAELTGGVQRIMLAEAYTAYMAATTMKDTTRDSNVLLWGRIKSILGHVYIHEVDTAAMDGFKQKLPPELKLGPTTVNRHLGLIGTVLRFMWKRGKLKYVPYVPKESVPTKLVGWYTEQQRDQLLDGLFEHFPHWYLFFYLTCRLGLRRGEVYAISYRQIRDIPPVLVVDQALQKGTKERQVKIIFRKNNAAYELMLTEDIIDAIRWHKAQGYGGEEFLFSKDGSFPKYLDSYVRSLRNVQKKLRLRLLSHKALGRHSVASQAATSGKSIKAIQAQLGHKSEQSTHRYAHLGSRAQLQLVESLTPTSPSHVNLVSTGKKKGS